MDAVFEWTIFLLVVIVGFAVGYVIANAVTTVILESIFRIFGWS